MKWYRKLSRRRSANPSSSECWISKPIYGFNENKTLINNNDEIVDKKDNEFYKCRNKSFNEANAICIKCKVEHCENGIKNKFSCDELAENFVDKLEKLIAASDGDERSLSSVSVDREIFVDPDEFFDDPEEVNSYRTEKYLADWDIVEVLCETTNEELDESFVQVKRTPSVISLRSYEEDTFGLFYSCESSCYQTLEAYYPQFFDFDIQFGKFCESSYYRVQEEEHHVERNESQFPKGKHLFYNSLEQEAFARSLMGPLLQKNNFCPLFNSSFKTEQMCGETLNIKQYFGLNDAGNIIIHFDHIKVEQGETILIKKCYRKLFKDVIVGEEMYEGKKFSRTYCQIVQQIFNYMREIIKGHPRNRLITGGPGETIGAYALSLANDETSTFSRNIENFISCTKESKEAAPQVVMRNMRQFMSGMKNYLVKHGEGDFAREVQKARSRLKPDEFLNLDTILEGVMHRLVILPLREHLYGLFVDYYTRSSDIQLLVENVKYAASRCPADFGIRNSVTPPTPSALRQISLTLVRLQEAELPLEKLDLLLSAVSTIFEATGCPRGQQLSADDFLPLLVYVVARCGFIGAEIEAEFMWGLLQPSLLSGEAGYYLTALCSAVHVLKSFMASDNEGTGSLDWRSSSLPACSSVLRVIIPDECNGSIQTRTLPIRPHTTTKEVCRIIAHKARITNAQDYALFKLVDGEETLLQDNECPQDVRMAARGKHCLLAYKRIEAKIAWPTMQSPSIDN